MVQLVGFAAIVGGSLLVLVGVLLVVGLIKGLIRILVGIGALVAAFVLASRFHEALAAGLQWIDLSIEVLRLLAYLGIFIGTMTVIWLVAMGEGVSHQAQQQIRV